MRVTKVVGGAQRRRDDERGASLVEFALLLPIFMMMVLGMFSGGTTYNRDITLTNAVREGSRYGATLPVGGDMGAFLLKIAKAVRDNSTGEMDDGVEARRICVAYVYPNGTVATDRTTSIEITTSFPVTATTSNTRCNKADGTTYVDGLADTDRRINVVASRKSKIEFLLGAVKPTLQSISVTRFEATT